VFVFHVVHKGNETSELGGTYCDWLQVPRPSCTAMMKEREAPTKVKLPSTLSFSRTCSSKHLASCVLIVSMMCCSPPPPHALNLETPCLECPLLPLALHRRPVKVASEPCAKELFKKYVNQSSPLNAFAEKKDKGSGGKKDKKDKKEKRERRDKDKSHRDRKSRRSRDVDAGGQDPGDRVAEDPGTEVLTEGGPSADDAGEEPIPPRVRGPRDSGWVALPHCLSFMNCGELCDGICAPRS